MLHLIGLAMAGGGSYAETRGLKKKKKRKIWFGSITEEDCQEAAERCCEEYIAEHCGDNREDCPYICVPDLATCGCTFSSSGLPPGNPNISVTETV